MSHSSSAEKRGNGLWLAAVVVIVTFVIFSPVQQNFFVQYDDPIYVTENPQVQKGLTSENIRWAFTTRYASFWHPVTWLSHMLDCQLFGLKPSGHHLTSLLLHLANTALLFLVLRAMTGFIGGSAFVAALFALHPLHVESVAWIAERKDLVSTLFWMLTMLAYVKYVQTPARVESRRRRILWYSLSVLFFVLGLMGKPMLVTLPFVLLLLDFWPLHRWGTFNGAPANPAAASWARLIGEKIPLFILSAVACVVAFGAQKEGGAIATLDSLPLQTRIINAVISYIRYAGKTLVPTDLSIVYPYHTNWPMWEIAGCMILLVGLTLGAFLVARRAPYLTVGWLWFVGTLVPVIGLVQVSNASMADRYTYVSIIGLFIAVAWGFFNWCKRQENGTAIYATVSFVAVVACTVLTSRQISNWRDTESLFRHAVKVTRGNHIAQYNLGKALTEQGRLEEAIGCFNETIRIKPGSVEACVNLAAIYSATSQPERALEYLDKALLIEPNHPEAHYNLGVIRAQEGKIDEAIGHYRKCLARKPAYLAALNNLAWLLATNTRDTVRDGTEAVVLARRACELTQFLDFRCVGTLAAAYAEAGDFNMAIEFATKARELTVATGEREWISKSDERLAYFRSKRPIRSAN